jgi:hypothetical protein
MKEEVSVTNVGALMKVLDPIDRFLEAVKQCAHLVSTRCDHCIGLRWRKIELGCHQEPRASFGDDKMLLSVVLYVIVYNDGSP